MIENVMEGKTPFTTSRKKENGSLDESGRIGNRYLEQI